MTPQVSVILPTHNRSAFLARAIRSVLDQTAADLELIVVDDASTDDTPLILAGIDDPRLISVRLDSRGGAARARNAGIARARGSLIAFQDSDDEWLPAKLESQLALMTRLGPGLGAVGGRYRIEAANMSANVTAPRLEAGRGYEPELLEGPCCITPVWLIRRELVEALGRFDEAMPCLEDWDLMLRLSERTPMRSVATDVLVKRGARDSLGANLDRRAPAMAALVARHGARLLAEPRRNASFCLELGYLCLLRGERLRAARYVLRALRRRGATRAMLVATARTAWHAQRTGARTWPVPGLLTDR